MVSELEQRKGVIRTGAFLAVSLFALVWSGVYMPSENRFQRVAVFERSQEPESRRRLIVPVTMIDDRTSRLNRDTRFVARKENRFSGRTSSETVPAWKKPDPGTGLKQNRQSTPEAGKTASDPAAGNSAGKVVRLTARELKQSLDLFQDLPDMHRTSADLMVNFSADGQVMLGTKAYRYAEYFHRMVKKIAKQWYVYFPRMQHYYGLLASGRITVVFELDRDGTVMEAAVVKSYGQHSLDKACLTAVLTAKEFGSLPRGLREKERLRIPFVFIYTKPDKKIPMFR